MIKFFNATDYNISLKFASVFFREFINYCRASFMRVCVYESENFVRVILFARV